MTQTHSKHITIGFLLLFFALGFTAASQDWSPVKGKLMTDWAGRVSPENVWPEYPRPQMVRNDWLNLNGLWNYAITDINSSRPEKWNGEILVPFGLESALSGVGKLLLSEQALWYKRTFDIPVNWKDKQILLYFEAADYEARVFVNNQLVGTHAGGYTPFDFNITKHLKSDSPQELVVCIKDPTNSACIPSGKQMISKFDKPGGAFYSPTSGIWQTVWLEAVPEDYIASLKITPDLDHKKFVVIVNSQTGKKNLTAKAEIFSNSQSIATAEGNINQPIELAVENPRLWQPGAPFLYDLKIQLLCDGTVVDQVSSYAGMRKIAIAKDPSDGFVKIQLNGHFLFQMGTLDQGFWPDGIYTAPCDEALRWDVEAHIKLGYNMIRKHIKIEPARWYYWCDKLGLLVWQDAVSLPAGYGEYSGNRRKPVPDEGRKTFERDLRALIEARYNHPSIVMWIVFNEGWGEFDCEKMANLTMSLDRTRLVSNATGGKDCGVGHIFDLHSYPDPKADPSPDRATVCGEFGGINFSVPGHLWDESVKPFRFEKPECNAATEDEFIQRYADLIDKVIELKTKVGMSAAVFTQIADVECEPNGQVTYDRKFKTNPTVISILNEKAIMQTQQNEALDRDITAAIQSRSLTGAAVGNWLYQGITTPDSIKNIGQSSIKTSIRTVFYPIYDGYFCRYPYWRHYSTPYYRPNNIYKYHDRPFENYNTYPVDEMLIKMELNSQWEFNFGGYIVLDPLNTRPLP